MLRRIAWWRAGLLIAIALCAVAGARPACPDCVSEPVALALADGTPIAARLYMPAGGDTHLPAVVVVHGYLGNSGFVTVPWVADLTALGIATLVIDRRGHGESGGAWWPVPRHADGVRLEALAPDVRAAVTYLRGLAPRIDAARIALIGHSDGGTGAITAASADWDVAATVSLSASAAPWEYVNHVAPRNLLLVYGGADRFILHETDRLLISAATRGYLDGAGTAGTMADGSARRLVRVDGFGHLDVLFSSAARRTALEWVASALDTERPVHLSPQRWPWVITGLLALLLLVWAWNGVPISNRSPGSWPRRIATAAMLTVLWTAALAAAAWSAPQWANVVPVQEANIVIALSACVGIVMGSATIGQWLGRRRGWLADEPRSAGSGRFAAIGRGALAGLVVQLVVEVLLLPVYSPAVTGSRLLLFVLFLLPAGGAFAALSAAAACLRDGQVAPGVPVDWLFAALTAVLATAWFTRMSALPVVLLAAALLFSGAVRVSGRSNIAAAAFGTVMYARAAAAVCAFY